MRNTALFALALIASATTITPTVQAAEPDAGISVVQTADLDLSSAAGQRALERRIAQAAREVCGTPSDADLEGKNDVRKCRKDTIARVSAQREQLLASARSGSPVLVSGAR